MDSTAGKALYQGDSLLVLIDKILERDTKDTIARRSVFHDLSVVDDKHLDIIARDETCLMPCDCLCQDVHIAGIT